MQTARILQAVSFIAIVALVTSCAASKEYTSRIFAPRNESTDSSAVALKFLELDKLDGKDENWVNTDQIIDSLGLAKNQAIIPGDTSLSQKRPLPDYNPSRKTTLPEGPVVRSKKVRGE